MTDLIERARAIADDLGSGHEIQTVSELIARVEKLEAAMTSALTELTSFHGLSIDPWRAANYLRNALAATEQENDSRGTCPYTHKPCTCIDPLRDKMCPQLAATEHGESDG